MQMAKLVNAKVLNTFHLWVQLPLCIRFFSLKAKHWIETPVNVERYHEGAHRR